MGDHDPQGGPHPIKDAVLVDRHHREVLLVGNLQQRPGQGTAGIVVHDIEAPVAGHGRLDEAVHIGRGGHVTSIGFGLATTLEDLGHRRLGAVGHPVVHHDHGPLEGESQRRGSPDARTRSGYDNDPIAQAISHSHHPRAECTADKCPPKNNLGEGKAAADA